HCHVGLEGRVQISVHFLMDARLKDRNNMWIGTERGALVGLCEDFVKKQMARDERKFFFCSD
ncbi:hypothetical protein CDAR_69981, partial [Caerostris darwini]